MLIKGNRGRKMAPKRRMIKEPPMKKSETSSSKPDDGVEEEEEPVLIKGNRGRKMAPKRMMIKEPRLMTKEPRVMIKKPEPPVYMSLEEVGKRSKMFEREQREKYKSYLIFLVNVLPDRFVSKVVLNIFYFEQREFARAISVHTQSPSNECRGHIQENTTVKPPAGYKLTFYNDRREAEMEYQGNMRINMTMSRIPEHDYSVETYVVDVVPFHSKAGIRLYAPFEDSHVWSSSSIEVGPTDEEEMDVAEDDEEPDLAKASESTNKSKDPRPFGTRDFLTIQRIAARVNKSGGSDPPTPEEIREKKDKSMIPAFMF